MDNSIVGGVLSGLGKYFHIDPVILRIIYIAIFLILWFAAHKTGFFWLLAYAALWVVVPKAKTLDQKLAMQGADPSIENIENREEVSFNKPRNSGFGKVLKIISGIILGCIALGILISIIAVVAVFTGLYSASDFPSINEGLNLIGLNSFDFKLSFIAIIALPLIGLLYLCIKFLFQIRFTKKDAIISVIAFILWIGVSAYFGGTMYRYAKPYQKDYSVIQTIPITTLSDTLYVKLPPLYLKATPMFDSENIFYLENDNRKISSFIMPDIIIKKDTSCLNYQIEIKKHAKAATKRQALLKAEQAMFDYIIKDSLFIIRPRIYNKNNPWDREFFTIYITSPINKTVIVDELR